jgi:hypothetical protein
MIDSTCPQLSLSQSFPGYTAQASDLKPNVMPTILCQLGYCAYLYLNDPWVIKYFYLNDPPFTPPRHQTHPINPISIIIIINIIISPPQVSFMHSSRNSGDHNITMLISTHHILFRNFIFNSIQRTLATQPITIQPITPDEIYYYSSTSLAIESLLDLVRPSDLLWMKFEISKNMGREIRGDV